MKENKIRFWNKEKKMMSHSYTLFDLMNMRQLPNALIPLDKLIPLFYTGYKAKNGELYKGDLINDNMEVYWNYNCNAWAVRKFGDVIIFALLYKFITNCDEDNITIFGNIYERNNQGGIK